MSVDQSQEQDCTVYIEELKSDNPSLKLNAASKISVIASVLGHNRIRDELIPYLVEIIEQMDNDNDFLIKVAEGLLELKSFCTNNQEVSVLINPLKILASLDQPAVRDQAIYCLKKLAQGADKNFYEDYYFPLVQKLAQKGPLYSPRVVACCLIHVTYPNVSSNKQDDLRNIFKQLALNENSPLVRRALAENIQNFKEVVSKSIVRSDLLEIWQAFIIDPIDIIRIKALECAHVVAAAFKNQQTSDKFFKFIKQVDPNKKSWRIRYSLAQCLANIVHKLDKQTIKKEVTECLEELLKDDQAEVRAISLLKASTITEKLSKQQSYTTFFQYFQKSSKDGTKDAPPTVKLALVQSIVPYFKTIDSQKITQNGVPILSSLLKDQNLSVRIGIIQSIGDLHATIGKEGTVKHIIPMIEGVMSDKKWRFKLSLAENIEKLFKTLGYEDFKEFFDKLLGSYMKDHNYSVRQQTIKCLINLKQTLNPQTMTSIITKFMDLLSSDINYIYRCSSIILLENTILNSALDKKQSNQLFLSLTQKLSEKEEKIPNVLIFYFDCVSKVKTHLNNQSKKQFATFSRKVQETISDEDVLFYLHKAEA